MQRAAVLIGVSKTRILGQLQAVDKCLDEMERWAKMQGFQHVRRISDSGGAKVSVHQIKDVINELVELTTIDQLVVYFSGHGINVARQEMWLLTDAPYDADAAVALSVNQDLARYCGVPHVVFVSDACRTAAVGVKQQSLRGSSIFPNTGQAEGLVDQFFACAIGRPALEIHDPAGFIKGYRAIYTETLVEGLEGRVAEIIEKAQRGETTVGLVRGANLQIWLRSEVTRRILAAKLEDTYFQEPSAQIAAGETWISQVPLPPRRMGRARARVRGAWSSPLLGSRLTMADITRSYLDSQLRADHLEKDLPENYESDIPGARLLREGSTEDLSGFGPDHYETGCGFKFQGMNVKEAYCRTARAEVIAGGLVRMYEVPDPAANVLITFEDGTGVVLPAIPGFLAAGTFREGELKNVTYEPSAGSHAWAKLQPRLQDLRSLQAIAATATDLGVFSLDGEDNMDFASRLEEIEGRSPTLALYAAYAYNAVQRADKVEQMAGYASLLFPEVRSDEQELRPHARFQWFDMALLVSSPTKRDDRNLPIFPFAPMVALGWPLLESRQVELPPGLDGIRSHITDSLWTVFNAEGTEIVNQAMKAGVV
jgi:hypothetical protein